MSDPNELATSSYRRWLICLLLFAATTLNYMDRVSLNQMAARIQIALGLNDIQYSRLESGFSIAFAVGAVVSGVIVDRVSVRWVYPLVVFGWSVAGILTGYATGFVWLFVCRVALGLFEAGNWPCGIRTTRAVLRPEERSFGNALFQSGTAVGAIVTPVVVLVILQWADAAAGGEGPSPDSWKYPFIIIGWLGVVWVLLWFATVPSRLLVFPESPGLVARPASEPATVTFWEILTDRRFACLLILVVCINVTWHTYRIWLPKYLLTHRGYSEAAMTGVVTWYYLAADIGSWTIGLLTLGLARRGYPLHRVRLAALLGCAVLTLASLGIPTLPTGAALTTGLLLFAFGSLGLFPTYFALSQELSVSHQGKVSGTLGASAHVFLSVVIYPVQGWVVQHTGRYDSVLGSAGVWPLVAVGLIGIVWTSRSGPRPGSSG